MRGPNVCEQPRSLSPHSSASRSGSDHMRSHTKPLSGILYSSLRQNERTMWSRYLRNRIHDKCWNSALFMQGFRKCPRATTQAQRWHLFRIHFNGHMSSTRVHAALPSVAVLPCPSCGGTDSAPHLLECPTTRATFDLAVDALPLGAAYHGSWSELFFQSPLADAAFTPTDNCCNQPRLYRRRSLQVIFHTHFSSFFGST